MRNIILAVLILLSCSVASAQEAVYTFNFQGASDTLFPTQGAIDYNLAPGALNPFNLFTVTWDGQLFNYTANANAYNYLPGSFAPQYYNTTGIPGCAGVTGMQPEIVVLTHCTGFAGTDSWAARSTPGGTMRFVLFMPLVYYFDDVEANTGQAAAAFGSTEYSAGDLPFTIDMTPLNAPVPGGDSGGKWKYLADGCVCK